MGHATEQRIVAHSEILKQKKKNKSAFIFDSRGKQKLRKSVSKAKKSLDALILPIEGKISSRQRSEGSEDKKLPSLLEITK